MKSAWPSVETGSVRHPRFLYAPAICACTALRSNDEHGDDDAFHCQTIHLEAASVYRNID